MHRPRRGRAVAVDDELPPKNDTPLPQVRAAACVFGEEREDSDVMSVALHGRGRKGG